MRSTSLLMMLSLLSMPAVSGATDEVPGGLGGGLMLGGNFCIPNGDANCDNIDPSVGFSFFGQYRFIDFLAVEAKFFYGLYDTPDVDTDRLGVLGGLRAYLPISAVDIYAEADIGWGQLKLEQGGNKISMDGFTMAFGLGADYRVTRWFTLGLVARYHLPIYNRLCLYANGESDCDDIPDEADIAHGLMFGVNVGFYLP